MTPGRREGGAAFVRKSTASVAGVEPRAGTRWHVDPIADVVRRLATDSIRGLDTSDETAATIKGLTEELGKVPVFANDSPGFVSNRVLMPMINEAIFCVHEGVAKPEHVDEIMKLGMAHPMGPLALADLIGLDVCLAILEVLQRDLGDDKYRPCPLLRKMVAAGHLGRKTRRGFYTYTG